MCKSLWSVQLFSFQSCCHNIIELNRLLLECNNNNDNNNKCANKQRAHYVAGQRSIRLVVDLEWSVLARVVRAMSPILSGRRPETEHLGAIACVQMGDWRRAAIDLDSRRRCAAPSQQRRRAAGTHHLDATNVTPHERFAKLCTPTSESTRSDSASNNLPVADL
jgi:hypothetical protein